MWRTTRRIDASPEAVWTALTDTQAWPAWGPSVSAVECDHRFIRSGSRGRVRALGLWLPFDIDRFEPGRAWSWRIGGLQATDHIVAPVDGVTDLTFQVPWYAPPYLAICAAAMRRIANQVERGVADADRPSPG